MVQEVTETLLLIQMEELSYGASPVQGGSGGGSTHILLTESDLSALENNLDEILIVSGGGGASTYYTGWNGTWDMLVVTWEEQEHD